MAHARGLAARLLLEQDALRGRAAADLLGQRHRMRDSGCCAAALLHFCTAACPLQAMRQGRFWRARPGTAWENNGLMAGRHPVNATIPEVRCAVLVEAGSRMDNERLQNFGCAISRPSQRDGSIKQTGGRARLDTGGGGHLANHRRPCSRRGGAERVSRAPRLFRDFQLTCSGCSALHSKRFHCTPEGCTHARQIRKQAEGGHV